MNLNDMRRLAGLPVIAEASDEYDFGIETEEYGQHAGNPPKPDFEMVEVQPSVSDGTISPFVTSAPSTTGEEINFEDNSEDVGIEADDEADTVDSDAEEFKPKRVAVEDSEPDFDNEEDDIETDDDTTAEETGSESERGEEEERDEQDDEELKKKIRKGDDLHETYLHALMVMAQTGRSLNEGRASRLAKEVFGDQ